MTRSGVMSSPDAPAAATARVQRRAAHGEEDVQSGRADDVDIVGFADGTSSPPPAD